MRSVLIDNDIVAKTVAYGLIDELVSVLAADEVCVLGTVTFVISTKRLKSAKDGAESAHRRLKTFVALATVIEPSVVESKLAARLEQVALDLNVQLDVGESQLCAIAIIRGANLLCTGDKRAIAAIERLRAAVEEVMVLDHRLVPLEALVGAMVRIFGHDHLRNNICGSKGTDKAVEICFQCHNAFCDPLEAGAGLASYIRHLALAAPNVCAEI